MTRLSLFFSFLLCFSCLRAFPGRGLSSSSELTDCGAFEPYMELHGRSNSQGGACYGNFLFIGVNSNKILDVYDLAQKQKLGVISMEGANASCHANTLSFGTQFYRDGDEFPVLYISSGSAIQPQGDCVIVYVYRLQRENKSDTIVNFKSSLVQTINLVGFNHWTEFVVDSSNDFLWVRYNQGEKIVFLKYSIPPISMKKVVLTPKDSNIRDRFSLDYVKQLRNSQGMVCFKDIIYYPAGGPSDVPYWVVVNTVTHSFDYLVNLYEVDGFDKHTHRGNKWEPEFTFFFQGDYFIGFRYSIYKLNLDKLKQSNYFYNRYLLSR